MKRPRRVSVAAPAAGRHAASATSRPKIGHRSSSIGRIVAVPHPIGLAAAVVADPTLDLCLKSSNRVEWCPAIRNSSTRPQVPQGPLSGLRVLELATLIAGPFAGRYLADFGAEVIKIEQPGTGDPLRKWGKRGDSGESLWHLVQSRGKLSVSADLHDSRDQAFVRRLAMQSDVLLENFRPGRLEEWNLDPADLIAANPRLIVVRISGYGQDGPLRDQPGFGTIAEAAGGMRYVTGDPDRPPARTGLSLGDSIPSLHALVGLLIALHERNSSGRGQIVDVSLADSILAMLEGILPEYALPGPGSRAERRHRPQLRADQHLSLCRRHRRMHRGQYHGSVQAIVRGNWSARLRER